MDESISPRDIKEQAQELLQQEDGARGLSVGNHIYDALLFAPQLVKFSARQYVFLRHYRLGITLDEAAGKAGLTPEAASRFLEKPATVAWLKDRAEKDHIKHEWAEPSKWWVTGDEFLRTEEVPKHKIDVWREFGERVCPKVSRNAETTGSAKIEINIDPTAVQEAFRRQKVIEAQIVENPQ